MTNRLALLRAILARPADDTPRLVYADWLDDHAASDADKARVELIRLWYSLPPDTRSTTQAIARWLGKNWPRLWSRVVAVCGWTPGGHLLARGRVLGGRLSWYPDDALRSNMAIRANFDRGFAMVIQVEARTGYERLWLPFAEDEPLARFEPLDFPRSAGLPYDGVAVVTEADWGPDVFHRLSDPVQVTAGGRLEKRYHAVDGFWPDDRAAWAVAAVMTARAREVTGLSDPA